MTTYIYVITNNEWNMADKCKIGRHKGSIEKLVSEYRRGCTPTVHLFEQATLHDETNLKRIMYDIRLEKREWVKCSVKMATEYIRGYLLRYGEETYSYYAAANIKKILDNLLPDFADLKGKERDEAIKKVPFKFYYENKIYDRRKVFEWYLKALNDESRPKLIESESEEEYGEDELSLESDS